MQTQNFTYNLDAIPLKNGFFQFGGCHEISGGNSKGEIDYYPFGMLLPNRNGDAGSEYRYGFQGQEMDDEITGNKGTSYTAEFWQYDPRVARRWNVDPVVKQHESPYAAFANNPVWFKDPNGADSVKVGGADFWKVEEGDTYWSVGKKIGVDYKELQGYNSQSATNLKVGSLLSMSPAKCPKGESETSSSTPSEAVENGNQSGIISTTFSLSLSAIEKLGGLDEAAKLINEGNFKMSYNGQSKTYSLLFNGNQHVNPTLVKQAKYATTAKAVAGSITLKVVKGASVTFSVLSLAHTGYMGYNEYKETGSVSPTTIADGAFGVVALVPGGGWAVSGIYGIGRHLIVPIVDKAARASGSTFDNYGGVTWEDIFPD